MKVGSSSQEEPSTQYPLFGFNIHNIFVNAFIWQVWLLIHKLRYISNITSLYFIWPWVPILPGRQESCFSTTEAYRTSLPAFLSPLNLWSPCSAGAGSLQWGSQNAAHLQTLSLRPVSPTGAVRSSKQVPTGLGPNLPVILFIRWNFFLATLLALKYLFP